MEAVTKVGEVNAECGDKNAGTAIRHHTVGPEAQSRMIRGSIDLGVQVPRGRSELGASLSCPGVPPRAVRFMGRKGELGAVSGHLLVDQ